MSPDGRDPRRAPSPREKRVVFARSGGYCQRCGEHLDASYENAHLISWSSGGPTTVENMEAWCSSCNRAVGGRNLRPPEPTELRAWQSEALPRIVERMRRCGFATLHAAPGAGKTMFAGLVFEVLRDAGLVDRLVVVVPNTALVDQWRSALAERGIHLDRRPANGAIEHTGFAGLVTTYQSLPNSASTHAIRQRQISTLVVFDEVHHIATDATWGWSVRHMVGDIVSGDMRAEAVLNMTGTLFRSSPKQRISTVEYETVRTGSTAKIQAVADWSVTTRELISDGELRPPELYSYGGKVQFVDADTHHSVDAEIADLSEQQRGPVMFGAAESAEWIEGFARAALELLDQQLESLNYADPLKLLFITSTQEAARRAEHALNRVRGKRFAQLVTSDTPDALSTLQVATHEPQPCGIVAVRMITEGFDCPQVATVAYLTNITAPLTVAQTTARAMRVTDTERRQNKIIPARILIPDHPTMRSAFVSALKNQIPLTDEESATANPAGEIGNRTSPVPRYTFLSTEGPSVRSGTVLDQDETDITPDEIRRSNSLCRKLDIPPAYALRVALAIRNR